MVPIFCCAELDLLHRVHSDPLIWDQTIDIPYSSIPYACVVCKTSSGCLPSLLPGIKPCQGYLHASVVLFERMACAWTPAVCVAARRKHTSDTTRLLVASGACPRRQELHTMCLPHARYMNAFHVTMPTGIAGKCKGTFIPQASEILSLALPTHHHILRICNTEVTFLAH
jgi:hypothetical protein